MMEEISFDQLSRPVACKTGRIDDNNNNHRKEDEGKKEIKGKHVLCKANRVGGEKVKE